MAKCVICQRLKL